jgi:hypothetical protein
LLCSSGVSRADSTACNVPVLAFARPVSMQLKWRWEMPVINDNAN